MSAWQKNGLLRTLTFVHVNWSTGGVDRGQSLVVTNGACYIGAGERCDIVISRAGVADPVHALLTETNPTDKGMMLQNCAGRRHEPVQVNGVQIKHTTRVSNGDVITIAGRSFIYEENPSNAAGFSVSTPMHISSPAPRSSTPSSVVSVTPEKSSSTPSQAITPTITPENPSVAQHSEGVVASVNSVKPCQNVTEEPPMKRRETDSETRKDIMVQEYDDTQQPRQVDDECVVYMADPKQVSSKERNKTPQIDGVFDNGTEINRDSQTKQQFVADDDVDVTDDDFESLTDEEDGKKRSQKEKDEGECMDVVFPDGFEPMELDSQQQQGEDTPAQIQTREAKTYKARRVSLFEGLSFVIDPAFDRDKAIEIANKITECKGTAIPIGDIERVPGDSCHYFIAKPAKKHTRQCNITPYTMLALKCGYILVIPKFLKVFLNRMIKPTKSNFKLALPLPNAQGILTNRYIRQPYPDSTGLFSGLVFVLQADHSDVLARECWTKLLTMHGATILPSSSLKTHFTAVIHAENPSTPIPLAARFHHPKAKVPMEIKMSWVETCLARGCLVPMEPFLFYPGQSLATTGFLAAGTLDVDEHSTLQSFSAKKAASVSAIVASSSKTTSAIVSLISGDPGAVKELPVVSRAGGEQIVGTVPSNQNGMQEIDKSFLKTIEGVHLCGRLFKQFVVLMEEWDGSQKLARLLSQSFAVVCYVKECITDFISGTVSVPRRKIVFLTPHDTRFAMMVTPASLHALLQGIPCVSPEWVIQSFHAKTIMPLERFMPRIPLPCFSSNPHALIQQPLDVKALGKLLGEERRRLRFVLHDKTGAAVTGSGDINRRILEDITRCVGGTPSLVGASSSDIEIHFVSLVESFSRRRDRLPDGQKILSVSEKSRGKASAFHSVAPVSVQWLFDSIVSGSVKPHEQYPVSDSVIQSLIAYTKSITEQSPKSTETRRRSSRSSSSSSS